MPSPTHTLQPLADRTAIGLSLLCAAHCLLVPLSAALLPSIAALGLADEAFHTWMVIVVIPLSTFALILGCRKHRRPGVLLVGALGLACLCLTPLLGHATLGQWGERLMTLTGALLIAISHVRNYLLCRDATSCRCDAA